MKKIGGAFSREDCSCWRGRSRPDPSCEGLHNVVYHHLKHHHDAVNVFDMEMAQQMRFQFYQTLDLCVLCFGHMQVE